VDVRTVVGRDGVLDVLPPGRGSVAGAVLGVFDDDVARVLGAALLGALVTGGVDPDDESVGAGVSVGDAVCDVGAVDVGACVGVDARCGASWFAEMGRIMK
jgi:hypothetical protein